MEIPIKIIRASKSDLTEIEALQASSFPAEKQQPSHILEESIRKCADTFLLARDENQLLGYVLGDPQPHNPQCLEMHSLVIDSGYQRQGLGTLLLTNLFGNNIFAQCRDSLAKQRLPCSHAFYKNQELETGKY